jgi:hypothetical protein
MLFVYEASFTAAAVSEARLADRVRKKLDTRVYTAWGGARGEEGQTRPDL